MGSLFFSKENYFYKGEFNSGDITGRGVFFYSSNQDFYLGEVLKGKYHGKGLYYRKENNSWELNEYKDGQIFSNIKCGDGKPQSLEISKEIVSNDPSFSEIYIKPKDFFFEHYEVKLRYKNIREIILMVNTKETVFYIIRMEVDTKDLGNIINQMDQE